VLSVVIHSNNKTKREILRVDQVVYFSLERRINFAFDGKTFRAHCRAQEHFLLHLTAENDTIDPITGEIVPRSIFLVEKLALNFPQYFRAYQRTEFMELYKVRLKQERETK
jgi:hypothetical protein